MDNTKRVITHKLQNAGIDYLSQQVSIFESAVKSHKLTKRLSIGEIFDIIKNGHPHLQAIKDALASGKSNPNKGGVYIDDIYSHGTVEHGYTILVNEKEKNVYVKKPVKLNYFDYVKTVLTPIATYNANFNGSRAIANVSELTGFMYLDFDKFDNVKIPNEDQYNTEDLKEAKIQHVIKMLTDEFVLLGVWRSFSGNGVGALAVVKGLTVENFKINWHYFEKYFGDKGLIIDPQTKDMTRINVIPYDPNIKIRTNIIPFTATDVDISKFHRQVVKTVKNEDIEITNGIMNTLYEMFFDEHLNFDEDRMSYGFYSNFAIKANNFNLDILDCIAFLEKKANSGEANTHYIFAGKYDKDSVEAIFEKIYSNYSNKNGLIDSYSDSKILTGVNVQYPIDITDLKIKELLIFCNNKTLEDKITFLAQNCKRVGIKKSNLVTFIKNEYLESCFTEKVNYMNILYKEYSNMLNFGMVYKPNKEYIAKKRKDLIDIYESNGGVEYFETSVDSENLMLRIYKGITRKITENEENIFIIIRKFVLDCISYNVDNLEIVDFMRNNICYHSIDRYVKYYESDFLDKGFYEYSRGIRQKVIEEKKNNIEFSKFFVLKYGKQKVSDLNLTFTEPTYIVGKPNMGKTYSICNKKDEKLILVCPNTAAVDSAAEQYSIQRYREGFRISDYSATKFICTADSLEKLTYDLRNNNCKLDEFVLYIDEAHTLATSTSKTYKNKVLNTVMDLLPLFKNFILMSGTPFKVSHPALNNMKYINVEWDTIPTTNAQIVNYKDKLVAFENKFRSIDVDGKPHFVYYQNAQEQGGLGKLIDYMVESGVSRDEIQLINSHVKNEDSFVDLLQNERIKDNIKLVICTSLISEAINIQNENFSAIHFLTVEHPIMLEQTVNRFRKNTPHVYIYSNFAGDKNDGDTYKMYNYSTTQWNIIKSVESLLDYMPNITDNSVKGVLTDSFNNFSLMRLNSYGISSVDYLGIANKTYEIDKNNYLTNKKQFIKTMEQSYNWKFLSDEIDNNKMEKNVKMMLNKMSEERVAQYKLDCLNILKEVESDGYNKTLSNINETNKRQYNGKVLKIEEIDIRQKSTIIFNYLTWEDTIKFMERWITDGNLSDKYFNRGLKQLKSKQFKMEDFSWMDYTKNKFGKTIMNFYNSVKRHNPNRRFTLSELETWLKDRKKHYPEEMKHIDVKFQTLSFLRNFFEIKPVIDNDEVFYVFGGVSLSNELLIFHQRLDAYVRQQFETRTKINSTVFARVLNDMRKDLSLFSKDYFTTTNASKLLTTLYSTYQTNHKTVTAYLVTDMEGKESKGFNVKQKEVSYQMSNDDWFFMVNKTVNGGRAIETEQKNYFPMSSMSPYKLFDNQQVTVIKTCFVS